MTREQKRAHSAHSRASRLTSRATGQAPGGRTKFNYDSLGQVTSGRRYWAEGTPVAGQQFDYSFVTIASTYPPGQQDSGNVFLPRTPEVFGYDADGNLTSDGRWNYTWDAENRLIRLVANTAVGPQQRIDFNYDWQSRRIGKTLWNNTGGTGNPAVLKKFLYDGWNLLGEIDALNPQPSTLIRSYIWGVDLSGSMQGAGGVGGLLMVWDLATISGQPSTHFVAYDGNGNVAGLFNSQGATTSATYEYGPFGELIRSTGPMARGNPFRFSTKRQDDETDLVYYGYRYYSASTGRWGSRDPIKERGFRATARDFTRLKTHAQQAEPLYLFAQNAPVNNFDLLGLSCSDPCKWARAHQEGETAVTVCCGGKKYACLIFSGGAVPASDRTARSIIDACVLAHEQVHVDDPNYLCPKQCLWKHPTYGQWANPDPTTHIAGEHAAYAKEIECLTGGKSQCNGDSECEAQVDAEIAAAQRKLDHDY